ncbi:DsbA family protein [Bifidobacterium subtile]|uniref:DsbA family protein n=1 Tax=Bifidobacterium subtile TaxID=77635 RepID=UPI002F351D73
MSDKPKNANSSGGFVVSKGADPNKIPTVSVFFDPMCPSCGMVDRALGPTLAKLYAVGQINIELHPIAFLDRSSSDQYSTRAASSFAYVGEHDPDHLLAYMSGLFDEKFQPSETDYRPVSDARIARQAIAAGVDSAVAHQSVKGQYKDWIAKVTVYTIVRKELQRSSQGTFATPTILINGQYWSMKNVSINDLPHDFVAAIGLDDAAVGSKTAMPSIGADGKPLQQD